MTMWMLFMIFVKGAGNSYSSTIEIQKIFYTTQEVCEREKERFKQSFENLPLSYSLTCTQVLLNANMLQR